MSEPYLRIAQELQTVTDDGKWKKGVDMDKFFSFMGYLPKTHRGKKRLDDYRIFASLMMFIQSQVKFKLSSRGWAYQLEGFGLVNKDQFNRVEDMINICRKEGFLPLDFVAEEVSRKFQGVYELSKKTPEEVLAKHIQWILSELHYNTIVDSNTIRTFTDYWEGEEYFLQVVVEKVDLVTLFKPICKKYKIRIANMKGWTSILQRADLIEAFRVNEKAGRKPVVLMCGDHDPEGIAITDTYLKNLYDLMKATGWNPRNLIVDRIGLNEDFIDKHGLTWINNLTTGSGKQPDLSKKSNQDYVDQFGWKKCEANAIVVRPNEARKLIEDSILKYLGKDTLKRFAEKEKKTEARFEKVVDDYDLREPLEEALEELRK